MQVLYQNKIDFYEHYIAKLVRKFLQKYCKSSNVVVKVHLYHDAGWKGCFFHVSHFVNGRKVSLDRDVAKEVYQFFRHQINAGFFVDLMYDKENRLYFKQSICHLRSLSINKNMKRRFMAHASIFELKEFFEY